MIDERRLQRFKAHRESRIPLGRLSVLVGPNGAGKTVLVAPGWTGAGAHAEVAILHAFAAYCSGRFDAMTRQPKDPSHEHP